MPPSKQLPESWRNHGNTRAVASVDRDRIENKAFRHADCIKPRSVCGTAGPGVGMAAGGSMNGVGIADARLSESRQAHT
jgi:hypothetical protein